MKEMPPDTPSPSHHTRLDKAVYAAPRPSDYLSDLDGLDMTHAQKNALLETLFSIMKSYVDLGYGLDPVNKLIAQFERAGKPSRILANCKGVKTDQQPKTGDTPYG